MDPWITWRLVKLAALLVFAGGVFAAVLAPPGAARGVAGGAVAPVGAVLVWAAGWQMMKFTGREITEPWILLSVVASLVAVAGAAILAGSGRQTAIAVVSVGALVASTAWMVLRPSDSAVLAGAGVLSLAVAAPIAWLHPSAPVAAPTEFAPLFFRGVARAEGASLVLLLASTLSKSLWQAPFDGGTGVIGWVHGILVILYLPSLLAAGFAARWSWLWMVAGFVASLLPFGTFVFEALTARVALVREAPKA